MHKTKRIMQYVTILIVFISLSVLSIFASTALHKILVGVDTVPKIHPITECIKSMVASEKHRLLFLCLVGLSACESAAILVTYSRSYISKLQIITPEIYTPGAVGQNQYGSAKWMKEKDKAKTFATIIINPKKPMYKKLILEGKKDRSIIKNHVLDEENQNDNSSNHIKQSRCTFQKISKKITSLLPLISNQTRKFFYIVEKCIPNLAELKQIKEIKALIGENMQFNNDELLQEFETAIHDDNIQNRNIQQAYKSIAYAARYDSNNLIQTILISINSNHTHRGGMVVGMKKLIGGREIHYYIDDDSHVLCIGATRSGKSRTVVLQSICNLGVAGESMVISDPKSELYQYTTLFLQRLGYKVIVLDFKNPLKSHSYNLLQPIIDAIDDDNIPQATECVWDLVSILVGEAKGEKIWTNGEASTIACAIMSVVYDNQEGEKRKYQTLTNVYYFIAEMCKPIGKFMPIVEYVKELPVNHPAKPLVAISEIAPERTRGSFYTAALTTLKLFTSSYINAMTNNSDYNPKDLGREKTALFFVLPDERVTYYSIASTLVLQHYIQLVNESDGRGGRLKKRVNFILDEFGVRP